MEYQVALSPELGISPHALVGAWNAHPATHAEAQARLDHPTGATFDPTLLIAFLTVAGTVTTSVLSNLLTELLKEKLFPADHPHPRVRITAQDLPDGSHILIVEPEDD